MITIHGNATVAAARHFVTNGLDYLLGRLIRGDTVADDALEPYGLTIFIEEDCDQGDDGAAP